MKILIKPIAIILINTILLAQAKIVSTSGKPIKVAYAGVKIENMESWAEAELQNKFKSIFNGLNPSQVILSEEVNKIAKAQGDSLFLDMIDIKSFRLPDWVKPTHYKILLEPNLKSSTFEGFIDENLDFFKIFNSSNIRWMCTHPFRRFLTFVCFFHSFPNFYRFSNIKSCKR